MQLLLSGLCNRGEREWLLDIWEREREWLSPFPNFGNGNGNEKLYSQLLGTGTGLKNQFPNFGNGNENSIPKFREREWDVVIPENDQEREREWHRKMKWNFFVILLILFCIVIVHKCYQFHNRFVQVFYKHVGTLWQCENCCLFNALRELPWITLSKCYDTVVLGWVKIVK